jgi:hypothetical protein
MRQPRNIEQAVRYLAEDNSTEMVSIRTMNEEKFVLAMLHSVTAKEMRKQWGLWWVKGHQHAELPEECPRIVEQFHQMDITHPEDMTGIILRSFHRHLNGLPLDVDGQRYEYLNHWLTLGYPKGIYDPDYKPKQDEKEEPTNIPDAAPDTVPNSGLNAEDARRVGAVHDSPGESSGVLEQGR